MSGYLYRFRDFLISTYSDDYPWSPPYLKVALESYAILKRTPKGAWIEIGCGDKKFVNLTARKQFACETIEQARVSYIARKTRQIKIYKSRLAHAQNALKIITNINNSITNNNELEVIRNNIDIEDRTKYTDLTVLDGDELQQSVI